MNKKILRKKSKKSFKNRKSIKNRKSRKSIKNRKSRKSIKNRKSRKSRKSKGVGGKQKNNRLSTRKRILRQKGRAGAYVVKNYVEYPDYCQWSNSSKQSWENAVKKWKESIEIVEKKWEEKFKTEVPEKFKSMGAEKFNAANEEFNNNEVDLTKLDWTLHAINNTEKPQNCNEINYQDNYNKQYAVVNDGVTSIINMLEPYWKEKYKDLVVLMDKKDKLDKLGIKPLPKVAKV